MEHPTKVCDMVGHRYGRLIVIGVSGKLGNQNAVLCKCDCGAERVIRAADLNAGRTKSCGCLYRETRRKPSVHAKSKLYRVWSGMKTRTTNPRYQFFSHYGGRGISVCEEWQNNFAAFQKWALANGYQEGLSIDRIDVNGDYCPENCRWATPSQQMQNTTRSRILTYNGESHTLQEWADLLGMPRSTLSNRINTYGWPVERALTTPIGGKSNE